MSVLFDVPTIEIDPELYQVLLSLRIGDGSFGTQSVRYQRYSLHTSSIKKDYLDYKRSILEKNGIYVRDTKCTSGYGSKNTIYGFDTRVDARISIVAKLSVEEVINNLDLLGLILYYLDDGSYHKGCDTIHLYCNRFSIDECNYLIEKIYELFPIKRCTIMTDRKKDGRKFPYLYMPKTTTNEFRKAVENFLVTNNITSMFYKANLPSQTIESIE